VNFFERVGHELWIAGGAKVDVRPIQGGCTSTFARQGEKAHPDYFRFCDKREKKPPAALRAFQDVLDLPSNRWWFVIRIEQADARRIKKMLK
jgi:hypothetical protein